MVSTGPDTQSYNFTHMYSFVDYRGNRAEPCITKGSIYDFLHRNKNFSKFRTIVERAMAIGQLNDVEADFTILVPSDEHLRHIPTEYFNEMDDGLARQILKASSINRRIDKKLITSSPVSYFITLNPRMRMYVTNISGVTRINNCAKIIKYDIELNNGLIHLVDGLIAPNFDHFLN